MEKNTTDLRKTEKFVCLHQRFKQYHPVLGRKAQMDAATQRLATHANYIHLKNTPRTATWTHLRSNNQSLFIHTASLTIKIVSRRIEQREMKVIYESVPPAWCCTGWGERKASEGRYDRKELKRILWYKVCWFQPRVRCHGVLKQNTKPQIAVSTRRFFLIPRRNLCHST